MTLPMGQASTRNLVNFIAVASMLMMPLVAFAQSKNADLPLTASKAPKLRDCRTKEVRDLGAWDEVFLCDEQNIFVLRRGCTLYTLAMSASSKPVMLASVPAAKNIQIVTSASSETGPWLFMQSSAAVPYAINTQTGQVVQFGIPGLKIPGSNAPQLQSFVIVPHDDAALLEVSGGDHETWPRPENRPVYFWMSLKSGKVVQFPLGWDLDYFSSDQSAAVFQTTEKDFSDRQPSRAVDVKTSDLIPNFPRGPNTAVVPYDWTDTQSVKPLYLWNTETRQTGRFAGLSVDGSVFPADVGLAETYYLSTVKVNDGFAGFRFRHEGNLDGMPSSFWLMHLKHSNIPELAASGTIDFALLKGGNCVYTAVKDEHSEPSSEAWFRNYPYKIVWNVLDGVKRLPDLDKEFVGQRYIQDRMTTRLIDGTGGVKRDPIVLCVFEHVRGDMRDFNSPGQKKRLQRITWRRAVLVTSNGERYMTDLFREGIMPNYIWIGSPSQVFTGHYVDTETGRKIQLSETTLQLR